MTLIASTLNFKKPFLISDLVWSSSDINGPIIMPTNSFDLREHLPAEKEEIPIRLYQKMYFIKENTCIVFAGFSDEIKVFLTVFKHIFRNQEAISTHELHDFLNGYDLKTKFLDSAFFIMNVENLTEGSITVGQFNCPSITNVVDRTEFIVSEEDWNQMFHPIFDKVSACGTGAKGYLNIVNQDVFFHSKFEDGDFMKAVQTNATLIVKILALERVSLYTLKNNWGGGFETAYFNGLKFEKISNIAYIIFHNQFHSFGEIGLPLSILVMYYKYINDILYIITVEINKYETHETDSHNIYIAYRSDYKLAIFEIEGLDVDNIEEYDLPLELSFSTDKIAIGYSIVTKANTIFNPALFNLGPEIEVHFQQGNNIELKIEKGIEAYIRDLSREKYSTLDG